MSVEMQPSATAGPTPTFHSDDVEALGEYRTLSVLALVSLIVGLLSPLCFAAPLALTIPLIGIAISIITVRRIDLSDGLLAGRWAAIAGLALSIGSLVASLSHGQVTRYLLVREAEQFGRDWLSSLLSGDTRRAYRLTSTGAQPEPPDSELGPRPTKDPYDEFVENPVIDRLTEVSPDAKVILEGTTSYATTGSGRCWIWQRYVVQPATAKSNGAKSSAGAFQVDLQLQRSRLPREGASRWLVLSYRSPTIPAEHTDAHDHPHVH